MIYDHFKSSVSNGAKTMMSTSLHPHNKTLEPAETTSSPLPHLNWASSVEMWQAMKRKERELYRHDWRYMADTHVDVEPKMRAILLDWLVEIAHAYRLHRETFHLSVEYFDRFMTACKQRVRVDRSVISSFWRRFRPRST